MEQTAEAAFAAYRAEIARLLDVLAMELEVQDGRHAADPDNWGPTCNLGKIRDDLVGVVAFASNKGEQEVHDFLDHAV